MENTSVECSSSSCVITSGAGCFWRCHQSTTGAMAESLEKELSRRMQSRFRLENSGWIFSGRGRTVENDALQVLSRGLFHAADEFVDLFFCDHFRNLLLFCARSTSCRTRVPARPARTRQPGTADGTLPGATKPAHDYQLPLAPPPPELPPPNPPKPPPPPPKPPPPL